MPQISVRIQVLTQQFEEGTNCRLGEALFFPEITCLADEAQEAAHLVAENVLHVLRDVPNAELHRRVVQADAERWDVELVMEPPERSAAWREPVTLRLPAVKWQQAADAFVAYVPALQIEVLANREADLPQLVEQQVRAALFRAKATRSLRKLVEVARGRDLQIESRTLEHFVVSPKQQAREELQPENKDGSVLSKIAEPLTGFGRPQAFQREDDLRRLADVLGGRVPRSALLVGPSGVGKTALVRELARRSAEFGLGPWAFWSTSGSRLVSGMTGFGMWQERCEALRREVAKKQIVLHLGALLELMEVGKSEYQHQGIASFLRPALARGELLAIAECTPEQVSRIERQDVALLRAFQQIPIEEPSLAAGRAILTRVAQASGTTAARGLTPEAVAEIDRLHRRFATYSAFPARPIRFLQNLRRDQASGVRGAAADAVGGTFGEGRDRVPTYADGPVTPREVRQAFSRETGLPLWLLDEHVPLDLAATEQWFAGRVIGQAEAVSLVVNLLATLKAGLNRAPKPLASFLFIGPTGVGKTEMAKTLAAFLFGAAGGAPDARLIRVDMSEYADPRAVQRLIGGTSTSEGVLTARVREQPFAVVLLDEFEKADPSLFDLLLQVLGEGRLTDAAGRVADFRNCVLIMTSNLGAATFAKGSLGFGVRPVDAGRSRAHFERAVREFVRPELFGRIDRIVPFAPLDRDTARRVVARELDLVQQRDGLKYRRLTLDLDDGVIEYLLARGFEPQYGARALKRVIEQDLLAPLAQRINQYSAEAVLRAECRVEPPNAAVEASSRLTFAVRAQTDVAGRVLTSAGTEAGLLELVTQLTDARAALQRLQSCPVVVGVQNEVARLERWEVKWNRRPTYSAEELTQRRELDLRRAWLRRLDELYGELVSREDGALLALHGTVGRALLPVASASTGSADGQECPSYSEAPTKDALRDILRQAAQDLREQLFDLLDLLRDEPTRIRVALIADDAGTLRHLAGAYHAVAVEGPASCTLWQYLPPPGKREPIADRDWTLEKLRWELVDPPPKPPRSETWHLKAKPHLDGLPTTPLLLRERVSDPVRFLAGELAGVLGLVFELSGPRIFARFVGEDGLHRFVFTDRKSDCVVQTALPPVGDHLPPFGIERRGGVAAPSKCRDYDFVKQLLTDAALPKPLNLAPHRLVDGVRACIEQRHQRAAEQLLDES